MLKIDQTTLDNLEKQYDGIIKTILHFENASLPSCVYCQSSDTADVQVGVIGRTICIAGATTKFKLIANGPKPGKYFCNACQKYFDE
jgi:hypothetical protein